MLAIELHAGGSAVLVDLEPVREVRAHAGAQLHILGSAADVGKGNGIDRRAAGRRRAGLAHRQLEMPAADDASLENPELAIEDRFGKSLAPRPGLAQQAGGIEAKVPARELT